MMKKPEKLYMKYEALSPIYSGGLTNHLPMMFTVLIECGVELDRIEEILDGYKEEKDLYELTDITYPTSDFEQAYINQTSFYLGQLHELGVDIVLGVFMDKMKMSLSSGLFHGLIRLAYGLKSNHDVLIAQGLAYFEGVKEVLEAQGRFVPVSRLQESLEALFALREGIEVDDSLVGTANKFAFILQQPSLKNNVVQIEHIENHQKEMLTQILRRYKDTQDFYTLHVITGYHALLEVEQYLPDFNEVLNQFWYAAQLYMVLESKREPLAVMTSYGFAELLPRIDELVDAHDLKLCFSLSELYKRFELEECLEIANSIFAKYE